LGALLWYWTLLKIDADESAVEKNALEDAKSLSHDYTQYLTRAIDQVDQITLEVKYNWEHSRGKVNLEEFSQHGIYRIPQVVNVLIVNRNGVPITYTHPDRRPVSLADRDYFLFHRSDASDLLLIGKPVIGRLSGKPIITFTRRLNAADGSFDGLVVVSVEPEYFTSFYAGPFPGKTGLLAVVGQDGTLRAAIIGSATQQSTQPPLRAVPLFDSLEGSGLLTGEEWFSDKQARLVAWRALKTYPMVVVAGLSEEELLASHRKTWALYRYGAMVGSILMFLFVLVATGLSVRLAWKKHQEEEVRKTYRMATEGGNEGFYMYHALRDKNDTIVDFELVDCNERGAVFYGTTKAELLGSKLSTFHPAPYFSELMNTFRSAMESGFYEDEVKVPQDSKLKITWARRKLVHSGAGLAVTVEDITERRQSEERLHHLAHYDTLTDLPNRVLLHDRLNQAMREADRLERLVAVMFLDLDHFKTINDTLGHDTGDALLKAVAERLAICLRPGDIVSRLGGDEFTVTLANVAHVDDVTRVAQKILDQFVSPFRIGGRDLFISPSIGITLYPLDEKDIASLLKDADIAMYRAKELGRNQYQFYTPELNDRAARRLELETGLRQALERQEFILHYQPLVDMKTGQIRGMEALLRWQHPKFGLIPPLDFIPLAEETGLIIPIGEWVLKTACAQIKAWHDTGFPALQVAVNLSSKQLRDNNLTDVVRQALKEAGIEARYLDLELTESVLMQDMELATTILKELNAVGVSISLDDFGTGYSSLSYLKRFPIDYLKIDRSFVHDITTDSFGAGLVQAIIAMASVLKIKVIAEGVETQEQLEMLHRYGCDITQGYYCSKPLAVEAFTDLLHNWQRIRLGKCSTTKKKNNKSRKR
jgi:diguanylate cyclase (GGDEF)-like protein/PAS domain S-box-containing protein